VSEDRIVSVGLLTQRDLEVLGRGFSRHFPVPQDATFDELIRKLNSLPAGVLKTGPRSRK
jgi:hypothetical protein